MQQRDLGLGGRRRLSLDAQCSVELHEDFVGGDHDELARELIDELPWVQEVYRRGGRSVPAPRLTSFHGAASLSYSYSGQHYAARPLTPLLARLQQRLCRDLDCPLNCVLANFYRDGNDSVGYHSDDEPELGPSREDIVVASLSLGAARRFVLKHREHGERHELVLPGGSLLVMRGRTQHRYLHALPKTRRPVGPRVNLTYRVVVPPVATGA